MKIKIKQIHFFIYGFIKIERSFVLGSFSSKFEVKPGGVQILAIVIPLSYVDDLHNGDGSPLAHSVISPPCQSKCELLPSLGVRRLSSVNISHFNLL